AAPAPSVRSRPRSDSTDDDRSLHPADDGAQPDRAVCQLHLLLVGDGAAAGVRPHRGAGVLGRIAGAVPGPFPAGARTRGVMLSLALLLALGQVPGTAQVHPVGPGGHASVAAAVASAAAGDTVRVAAGRHHGTLIIDRPLVLLGEPGAILDGERQGTVLSVRADSVVIEGLTITGSGRSLDRDEAAIKLERCTGCRISGNIITDPLHGIY